MCEIYVTHRLDVATARGYKVFFVQPVLSALSITILQSLSLYWAILVVDLVSLDLLVQHSAFCCRPMPL